MGSQPTRPPRGADGRARRAPSRLLWTTSLLLLAGAASFAACGSEDSGEAGGGGGGDPGAPGDDGSGVGPGTGAGGAPPEEELESSFTAPVATGRYVWVANPTSGRVAYIDARTLEVRIVEAGHQPTHLAAIPDDSADVAIVLNVASRDATLLRAMGGGELTTRSFDVPSGGNRWAVSADGRWAIAWTDARLVDDVDPIDGFQDVVVLDLASEDATSVSLTVGYRPVAVAFDEASRRAFAVTQDGITVIDLAGGAEVVENVALSDDPLESTLTRDVAITPDGELALVRRDGEAVVTVHDLDDGERVEVELPAPATDLDLSSDGDTAIVVLREVGQVAVLPVPGIASDPAAYELFEVTSTVVGSASLADDGTVGFLYTNATPSPVLTVFDWSASPPDPRSILLRAPVSAVFPTPAGEHAVVLHDAFEVDGGSRYPGAVSLVPVADALPPKIVGLEAPVIAIAIDPDGSSAVVATGDAALGRYGLALAHLPSLAVEVVELGSLPIAAGIVAGADRGYVAQEHPDGRITFVDLASGEVRTLTGFELAAQVVDGGVR